MKRNVLAMLLAAAMLLAGCGGGNTAAPASGAADEAAKDTAAAVESVAADVTEEAAVPEGEKTVLTFYATTDIEPIAQRHAEEYMKANPNVEVKLSTIANDDYDDKIKVMLSGGADIDVFWVRGGARVRQMANSGAVLPLDDLMAANDVDFSVYGQIGDAYKTGGKTYALCTTKSCWLLWYNKDLFDAAGVEIPTDITWDEYADLCQQLNKDGLRGGIAINWILNTGAAAANEYLVDEDLEKTKEYAKFLHRIYVEDKSNLSIEEMSGSFDVNGVFAEGETYMMINGDWTFMLFPNADPQFEWGAVPLPHNPDIPVNSTVGSSAAYCINAQSKNPDAAFDFIKFCCYSDEGAKVHAEFSKVAAYPSDEALELYKQSVTIPGTEYVFAASVSSEDSNEDYYSELKDAYVSEVTEYLIDNCTLEEAFDNYKARREEIINK